MFSNDHRGRPSPPVPKIVMFGELSTGHRERGAPKKRFKDSLKKSLTTCNIDHRQWSDLAAYRVAWHHTIHQAAAQFEVDRKSSLKDKRQRRKACADSITTISFPILVPRGRAPFGQHQESRPLAPQRSNECACLSRAPARGNGLHHFHRNKQRQNGGRFKFRSMCFISRG